jgi:hypothetical protein
MAEQLLMCKLPAARSSFWLVTPTTFFHERLPASWSDFIYCCLFITDYWNYSPPGGVLKVVDVFGPVEGRLCSFSSFGSTMRH